MSVRGLLAGLVVWVGFGGGGLVAQQDPPQLSPLGGVAVQAVTGATGTVTGRVVAQDTQRAVRFAFVMLQAVPQATGVLGNGSGGRFGGFGGFGGGGGNQSARTDVDGNFAISGIAVGDYYVTASAPGFVGERALLQEKVAAGFDPAALLAGIPTVRVAADGTSSVAVTLERGGVISGRVVWEDGSAAAGLSLTAVSTAAFTAGGNPMVVQLPLVLQVIQAAGNSSFATTDDRGAFRIAGLTTGEYWLRVTIQGSGQFGGGGRGGLYASPVTIYSPGVFRRSEAKAVSVREGDERSDVRMVVDLRGLHTVTGHVSAASAGAAVVSGSVTLTDASDRTLSVVGSIAANGDFTVRYVPQGSYTMMVVGSSAAGGGGGRRGGGASSGGGSGGGFQVLTVPLVVGSADVSGLAVSLAAVSAGP